MTDYAGIDYSLGRANIDIANGIHYGVISQHSIMPEALADMEPDYDSPHCPVCGNDAVEYSETEHGEFDLYMKGCADYACAICEHILDSEEVFSEEALGFSYDADGYKLADCLDSDIFILASPYYTFAQFCSPCVPGAGNLDTPCPNGPKTYALGHDWFDDGRAPYLVYRVADDSVVAPE